MPTVPVDIRAPGAADAADLARLYGEAWRYAYRGIIPGAALEAMIARRGPAWWARARRAGMAALLLEFDDRPAGYATFGRCRAARPLAKGEIYELYLRPEYHGAGFGRALFNATRRALGRRGLTSLIVWSLVDNDAGCRFYEAMGGKVGAETVREIGGLPLPMVGYVWR